MKGVLEIKLQEKENEESRIETKKEDNQLINGTIIFHHFMIKRTC